MKNWKMRLLAASALAVIASPALAQDITVIEDESPIVLSGTVASVSDDEIILNAGDGSITVGMSEWDWFNDESGILSPGDQIVVSGNIDDDLFEGREIQADSIYLVTDSRYYYRDQASTPTLYLYSLQTPDQSGQPGQPAQGAATPQGGVQGEQLSWVSAVGTVQNVTGQQVTLDAGDYNLTVDVGDLGEPASNLTPGERVYVAGLLDQNFFQNRQLSADRLITLSEEQARTPGDQQRMQQPPSPARVQQPGTGQNVPQ